MGDLAATVMSPPPFNKFYIGDGLPLVDYALGHASKLLHTTYGMVQWS